MNLARLLAAAIVTLTLSITGLHSADVLAKGPAPRTTVEEPAPNEAELEEHGHYTNSKGESVHSPAHTKNGEVPEGASAQCRDGSYSFSRSHRGTCSHHGGVAHWL